MYAAMLILMINQPTLQEPTLRTPRRAFPTYAEGRRESIATGRPLAVFVGRAARVVPGRLACEAPSLHGFAIGDVVECRPSGGGLFFERYLEKGVQPIQAAPFREGEVRTVDDDKDAISLVAFLGEMEPYARARRSQISFRRWQGFIAPFPRSRLDPKWNTPGGLIGVSGWSSRLYRTKGTKAREFLIRQDPGDSSSTVTWDRSYPDGTAFADVLRNDKGKIFEIRLAEKLDGVWDRYVAYRNRDARPHGYAPPGREMCVACHRKAGRSEYGEAANPGGDDVFSDPMEALEHGGTVQGGQGTRL